MLKSYKAYYDHGHLHWQGEKPREKSGEVIVTVLTEELKHKKIKNGKHIADLLQKIAEAKGGIAAIKDPIAWQKEIRQDREVR